MMAWICAMIFWQHHASNVYFATTDMGMHVNCTRHDYFAA
jgi:hypothetical protein